MVIGLRNGNGWNWKWTYVWSYIVIGLRCMDLKGLKDG